MTLENEYQIIYNLKRIKRNMKKYDIVCPYRKVNPYKKIAKVTKAHSTVENKLKKFKQEIPGKVLLTDITYLFYCIGKKCYLSTIKYASTNEIIVWYMSESLALDISIDTKNK